MCIPDPLPYRADLAIAGNVGHTAGTQAGNACEAPDALPRSSGHNIAGTARPDMGEVIQRI